MDNNTGFLLHESGIFAHETAITSKVSHSPPLRNNSPDLIKHVRQLPTTGPERSERNPEKGVNRSTERGPERGPVKGREKGSERGSNRGLDRYPYGHNGPHRNANYEDWWPYTFYDYPYAYPAYPVYILNSDKRVEVNQDMGAVCGHTKNQHLLCQKELICNRKNTCVPYNVSDNVPLNPNRADRICMSANDNYCMPAESL